MKDFIIGAVVTIVTLVIVIGASFLAGKKHAESAHAITVANIKSASDAQVKLMKETESKLIAESVAKDAVFESLEKKHAENLDSVVSDNRRLRLKAASYSCPAVPYPADVARTVAQVAPELLPADSIAILAAASGCAKAVRERDELRDRYLSVSESLQLMRR